MPVCIKPITIPKPGLVMRPSSVPSGWRERIRPYMYDCVTVPCGKCINCLKRRQSDLAVRCQKEAEKRGSMCFCTLTYDDEHLPISSTLNRVNLDTGELQRLTPPEIVVSSRTVDGTDKLRVEFARMPATRTARYFDVQLPVLEDGWQYFVRYTPSICAEDIRLWLKRCRIEFKRHFKASLPDFSYICVQEYGPRTCRPHAHMAFFGLSYMHVQWLLVRWSDRFGYTDQKWVNRVNEDGSNGFARAAAYIGKYMSKGKFECDSVKDCAACKPRLLASKFLGQDALEHLRPWAMCFDLFGPYDPDSLRLLSTKRKLTQNEIDTLVSEIPKRFRIQGDGKFSYSLPVYYKRKIFYKRWQTSEKVWFTRPFTIWRLVADSLRSRFEALRDSEFRQFLSRYDEGTLTKAVSQFAFVQEISAQDAEQNLQRSLISFYSKSKF